MSGRVNVVLADNIYKIVKDLAQRERRSLSQMTAILIERGLGVSSEEHQPTPSNEDRGETPTVTRGKSKGKTKPRSQ